MRTLLVLLLLASTAAAQPAGKQKITLGIYAPSVEFGAATQRLAYVKALAAAIEQNTGLEVDAQSYANLGALTKANVDFAIIDGLCYATNMNGRLLATANVGGGTTREWALFTNAGPDIRSLRGKKLAFIAAGCNDTGFTDNAMLASEFDASFFGARIGKPDLTAAIAEVASYKTAQAVFAPVGSAKGLTKVWDGGAVPNPAFVDLGSKLPQQTVDKIAAAVIGYGGGGAIAGWTRPSREIYTSLAARLPKSPKSGVLAAPDLARIDSRDSLIEPPTIKDTKLVDVRHLYVRSQSARME
ncbi:MAG TPA: hypothetical protein VFQ53_03555 [Kofleriaceae bacterium]|nr:hypothetical protein [Kofleriaceae bacterium]